MFHKADLPSRKEKAQTTAFPSVSHKIVLFCVSFSSVFHYNIPSDRQFYLMNV